MVDKEAYLLQVSRYVHLNPVRAGIVKKPELYEWGSYGGYIRKSREVNWVEYAWVLSKFGRDKEETRNKYKKFVEEGLRGSVDNPFVRIDLARFHGRNASCAYQLVRRNSPD